MNNYLKAGIYLVLIYLVVYLVVKKLSKKMSNGKLSDNGLNILKASEKFSPVVYLDSAGKPTIGYGTLIDTEAEKYLLNKKITEAEATALMRKDVEKYEQAVNGWVKVPLTQNQFDALVIFAYNVGLGAFQKSTLLKNLNDGTHKTELVSEFRKYIYVTDPSTKQKVVSKGLQKRRETEAQLFLA